MLDVNLCAKQHMGAPKPLKMYCDIFYCVNVEVAHVTLKKIPRRQACMQQGTKP